MSAFTNPAVSPRLSVVANELPPPPYTADTKANGWKPELDIERILTSDTWVLAEEDERCWLLRIWMECWRSVPVGAMPADRTLFARRIGCSRAFLDAHAEILLRGWTLHSDGNLYHAHVSGMVLSMIATRTSAKMRMAQHRQRQKAGNHPPSGDMGAPVTRNFAEVPRSNAAEQEQEQEPEPEVSPSLPPSPLSPLARPSASGPLSERVESPPVALMDESSPTSALAPPTTQAMKNLQVTSWPRFGDFWDAYPRKMAREDARKAWNRLRLESADIDAILADLPRRVTTDRSWLDGYIPNPTTYLNGRRWEDAITPVAAVKTNGGRTADLAERNAAVFEDFLRGNDTNGVIEGECQRV